VSNIYKPPLRLAILTSADTTARARALQLEQILDRTVSGTSSCPDDAQSPISEDPSLGVTFELRVFSADLPHQKAADWLDATLHAVVVVLVDDQLLDDAPTLDWLRACARHLSQHPNRHRLIAVPFGESEQLRWIGADRELAEYQTLSWLNLDPEPAGRTDQLAMRILHGMIRVLAREVYGGQRWDLRLFLSHAKRDGFYLAQSLRYFVSQQSWLETFYDARDIEPGTSWKQALRDAVGQSIMLILRTDVYESRIWCRQEVRWAEAFAVPRIVIDARNGLAYPASELGLDLSPTVRIPDGNLARALFATLEIALRALLFQRRVTELQRHGWLPDDPGRVRILRVTPSIQTLAHACEQLARSESAEEKLVVYPDPPLSEGLGAAGDALAQAVGARLVTPGKLASEKLP
jgi:hypothetical protein